MKTRPRGRTASGSTGSGKTSVVGATDLYTEAEAARGRQGAKSEHIGHL